MLNFKNELHKKLLTINLNLNIRQTNNIKCQLLLFNSFLMFKKPTINYIL